MSRKNNNSPSCRLRTQGSRNRRAEREALGKVRGWQCHWCRKPLTLDTSTLEHIIPLSRGGTNQWNNKAIACERCNKGRAGMSKLGKDISSELLSKFPLNDSYQYAALPPIDAALHTEELIGELQKPALVLAVDPGRMG